MGEWWTLQRLTIMLKRAEEFQFFSHSVLNWPPTPFDEMFQLIVNKSETLHNNKCEFVLLDIFSDFLGYFEFYWEKSFLLIKFLSKHKQTPPKTSTREFFNFCTQFVVCTRDQHQRKQKIFCVGKHRKVS